MIGCLGLHCSSEICHWRASSRLFIPRGCNVSSTRDSVKKAREDHLINKAKTVHPLGIKSTILDGKRM